jgi:hypothetical protein
VGSFLLFACSDIWNKTGPTVPLNSGFQIAIWLLLLAGLGLMALAALAKKPERWSGILLASVLLVQWVLYASFAVTDSGHQAPSDTVLVSLHAAVLNTLGQNPYAYNMNDVYSAYAATGQAMTPHLDGGQVEKLPYPALHFLLHRPLLAQGVEGARFLYSLAFSLLIITLYFYCPKEHRVLILLPMVVNPEFIHYPFYWSSDAIWALLLALTLFHWKRPVVRAILLGLACAFKQNAWVFAPFIAVKVLRQEEKPWRSLAKFIGISVATFAVINFPWAWQDFGAWFSGTFDPLGSPYVPLGRGLSTLTQTGLIPFPKVYYSCLTYLAFGCAIWLFYLDYHRLRPLLWVFPSLVLFFSYRSMQHYFIFAVPLVAMEMSRMLQVPTTTKGHPRWYAPPLVFALGVALSTILFWPAPSGIEMKIVTGSLGGGGINSVEVELFNGSDEPLRPSFFGRSGWRTYPWEAQGPVQLQPGESRRYKLTTDMGYRSLSAHAGGQILVTHGVQEGRFLAVAEQPPQEYFSAARGIDEPNPYSWGVNGLVEFDTDIAQLKTTEKVEYSSISQSTVLPYGKLSFEMKRPEVLPEQAFFGLQVSDSLGRKLSLVLGTQDSQGYYGTDHFFRTLPSSPGWNTYEVDLSTIYQEAGFPLPPFQRVLRQDVELLDRPIDIRFLLYSEEPIDGLAVRGVQVESTPPGRHIAEFVHRKDEYRLLLADVAARRRKFEEAMEVYSELWPLKQPLRGTQDRAYLAIPKAQIFEGRFPLAGSGWAEPELFPGGPGRPTSAEESTINIMASPGLELELKFYPPTAYRYKWEDEWRTAEPGEALVVPGPVAVRKLTVTPVNEAALQAIVAR